MTPGLRMVAVRGSGAVRLVPTPAAVAVERRRPAMAPPKFTPASLSEQPAWSSPSGSLRCALSVDNA